MSEPISRQTLEEAVADIQPWVTARQSVAPNSAAMTARLADAARAILDAPPLEWCMAHRSNQIPDSDECWAAESFGTPCQFETYVRVKVDP